MDKKRTPNQAWADMMAAWQLPDAEADRLERIRKIQKQGVDKWFDDYISGNLREKEAKQ